MDIEKQIYYWRRSSELDLQTENDIFESGKNLHFCLYLCHLSLEKLIKAIVVKITKEFPPKSHNLLRLAEIAKIELSEGQIAFFEELNQFQLSTRYPDEKFTLYTIATKEFVNERFNKMKELYNWLTQLI